MKQTILTLIMLTIFSCGGGDDSVSPPIQDSSNMPSSDPPDSSPTNSEPTVPNLIFPTNNLLCIDSSLDFEWSASTDPEQDPITYTLEIAKNISFSELSTSFELNETLRNANLEKGFIYYWKVKATDNKNASSAYSEVFTFYTEGVGITNHLPFSPELISPQLNSEVTTSNVILKWNANDVDTNDTLTYDIYLGDTNPPTEMIVENLNSKTFSYTAPASNQYFWYVVVKDSNGGETIGQTWSFTSN